MSKHPTLSFYLEPGLKESAEAGRHNFLGLIAGVARGAGMGIRYFDNSLEQREKSAQRDEWAVFHMDPPSHDRVAVVRRAYTYPFWSIERTERRWEFDVAKADFDAGEVAPKEATRFAGFWRKRLFGEWGAVGRDGVVYVPLQGRLDERRSFQTCSPLEMIEAVLEHEKTRRVVAALHPKETYTDQELARLEALAENAPRLTIGMGGVERLLPRCDYVVTMNSGVGFSGLFLHKPLVLFGQIDFHHIAARADRMGAKAAIEAAPEMAPDYDAYLWWFLQKHSVNAGRPEAAERIRERLLALGWPV
jgi:hypothetical protein